MRFAPIPPQVPNPTAVKFGVLQKAEIKFAGQNKQLFGQYQFPQDVARGPIKVTGKATSAQIFSSYFDLFFGEGVTSATGLLVAVGEAASVPGSGPYTVTVTHSGTFTQDLGVISAATGIPFVHVIPHCCRAIHSLRRRLYILLR